ncbi:septal ring lytic transglycosylase RlpA family protein [Lichenicoccus sp.]|uniref:septal ring lytic transglycosylase RlpA family protein n=1 Tax=Lichenicoccus sp. TaxID=2781899 RepID=UPI003D11658F
MPTTRSSRALRVGHATICCTVGLLALGLAVPGAGHAASIAAAPAPPALAGPISPHATSWANSVHDALARQARLAAAAARSAFTESGIATWYGREFQGRRTSSGDRFDDARLTCAHRTLPLGTRLLVTSEDTGRSVVVVVNDRGPYAAPGRIIDLSRAAAARIGMVADGVNTVTVKRILPSDLPVEVAQAPDGDTSEQAIANSRR